jgi:hypothetical protein
MAYIQTAPAIETTESANIHQGNDVSITPLYTGDLTLGTLNNPYNVIYANSIIASGENAAVKRITEKIDFTLPSIDVSNNYTYTFGLLHQPLLLNFFLIYDRDRSSPLVDSPQSTTYYNQPFAPSQNVITELENAGWAGAYASIAPTISVSGSNINYVGNTTIGLEGDDCSLVVEYFY